MISRKKVLEMIEKGEGLNIEFKQRFSSHEKIAKEMIAFANTRGGFIIIGVDDDKSIFGTASEKSDVEFVNEASSKFCEPPVKISIDPVEIERKDLLVIEVAESNQKPHRIQDYKTGIDINTAQIYVRVNDKSILASKEMIKILQTKTSGRSLEKYVVGDKEKIVFDLLDKKEFVTVKELSKLANISERRASRTLIKLVRADILLIHQNNSGESFFTYAG